MRGYWIQIKFRQKLLGEKEVTKQEQPDHYIRRSLWPPQAHRGMAISTPEGGAGTQTKLGSLNKTKLKEPRRGRMIPELMWATFVLGFVSL